MQRLCQRYLTHSHSTGLLCRWSASVTVMRFKSGSNPTDENIRDTSEGKEFLQQLPPTNKYSNLEEEGYLKQMEKELKAKDERLQRMQSHASEKQESEDDEATTHQANNYVNDDDTEDWVPPERPLAGDIGESYTYAHIEDKKTEKELEIEREHPDDATAEASTQESDEVPDWLKMRRSMLGGDTQLSKPRETEKERLTLSDIPVLKHTLLTRKEIRICLEATGGQDLVCVLDNVNHPRMGDANGIIIATGLNQPQLRNMAETILRQLRLRKLEEVGCVGAAEGIEGELRDPNEDWMVVDCFNYIVHVQTPSARKALNLEGLWTGLDGTHKLDISDEEAVDEYVAANPVPEWYHAGSSPTGVDWDRQVKQLKKTRFERAITGKKKVVSRVGRRRARSR